MQTHYPFCAVVDNEEFKKALCLCVLDPSIGGVVVEGDRGSAKSTLARGLAALLSNGEFVNLPLGASEEQLIGSLDIDEVLSNNNVKFKPGLLAKADNGVLYIDEVNLLADHLTDVLLDVATSGVNIIERDGISHQHRANLVLIGSMNPDEGILRPQLLDRFGFCVLSQTPQQSESRKEVVKRRLEYEADPIVFADKYELEQAQLKQCIEMAKLRLEHLEISEAVRNHIADVCLSSGCEGLRADIIMYKATRANAAFEGRDQATISDVDQVKELVLRHRRKQLEDAPSPKRRPPDSMPKMSSESGLNKADQHQQVEVEPVDAEIKEKKS